MKALAICGSRHAAGSTEHLLKRCLERLGRKGFECSLVGLYWKQVEPCADCGACRVTRDGHCALDGDDFVRIYKMMREADIILVGAPVDLGAAPSDLKHLLERSIRVSHANGYPLFRKIGAALPVLANQVSGHSLQRLLAWFMAQGMITPGVVAYPFSKGAVQLAVPADGAGERVADELADNLSWLADRLHCVPSSRSHVGEGMA